MGKFNEWIKQKEENQRAECNAGEIKLRQLTKKPVNVNSQSRSRNFDEESDESIHLNCFRTQGTLSCTHQTCMATRRKGSCSRMALCIW